TTNLEDMRFFTGGTEKMRISETGNVAVGVQSRDLTNPEKFLGEAGSTGRFNGISGRGTINYYLQLNIQNRSNGANASSDVVASANNATESVNFIDMGINSSGYNSTLLPILNGNNTAYLYGTGRDFVIGNAASTYNLLFFTDGFDVTDEKLRITSAGNVGIGTTSPADKLSVAGAIVPAADNTYTLGKSGARWSAVWAANGVIQTSDARLKTDIEPLQYGLKEVLQLRPVSFKWKNERNSPRKLGLLAQEVQPIIPEVIANDEQNGILGMNYAELVPVLINAIKEQQRQIEEIQNRITDLKKIIPATASH
ncbi:MAG: tail fiber domain-containing protein, partial [Niastella sp.]|uniref:tail fiber domain-containing protein n=1 Tax=Niastella sp. TaxID=1869183 RepID=UPI003899FBA6